MKHTSILVPFCALLCATAVQAQAWSDNFDSYTAGAPIVGLGGWEEWGPGAGANLSSVQALSAPNAIDIAGPTDLVHQYPGVSGGKWVYRTMQYIPSGTTGLSYFILLNTYDSGQALYNWSVQVGFDAAAGTLTGDFGAGANGTAPLVLDAWVEIKVFIDLDNDLTEFFYNGEQVGPAYSWTGGVFGGGGGVAELGAVDLYANSATSVFYDDMEVYPFEFETFGDSGCPGSQGDIDWSLQLPGSMAGGAFVADMVNLPTAAAFNVLSTTKVNPGVDLTFLGMTNCLSRVTPEVILTSTTVATGSSFSATIAVAIPVNTVLLGANIHMQALALDPGINPFGFVLSKAMTFVILP